MAMLAVSACTQNGGGTPTPSSSAPATGNTASSATPSATGGANTVPAITNPLDVSKFMADPCLSITSAQAANLTISSQGKRVNIESGESCTWKYGSNSEWEIGVTYIVPEANNGLQNLYNLQATVGYGDGYFEPATVDNYPAVYQDISDDRQNGRCQLSVGVNNQVFFTVSNDGPKNTDLCKGAGKAANAVVETIKRG
ncbi:DUF3558 domain-containing protein [Amycolatopsis taiwanensis]|uniref:DUF3558 domain-containing protein n=1 Tax=Amycolatopsis taiwanensis TaxID=342230 RepID=UPI000A018A80|nr:DUF3558 domain-containing protein [Amycolatopsis taiwanensis]